MKISWPWKCSCDKHPAYCWDWHDDEVIVCSRKNAATTPHPFSNKRSPSQFSHERQSPSGGKNYFSEMYSILSTREERFRIFRGALLKSSIFFRQCETHHKCPVLATRSLLSFFILSSTLLRGVEVWKSLTK